MAQNYNTGQIRNVVLLSHGGAGKTSLSEAMLFTSGAISRLGKVDDGSTTSDYDPEEVKRRISINLSPLPCPWKDNKINLLDTPGYADFIGGVIAGIRVADGAVMVVCATSGVEVGTEMVWKYTEERELPRLLFINKMDRENADFHKVLAQVQEKFGRACIPVQLPIGSHTSFQGIVDLIEMKAYKNDKEEGIDPSIQSQVDSFREKLVEAVAENDDELTEKYLEGGEITAEEIYRALEQGVKKGKIVPVLTGSAIQSLGMKQLFDAICRYLPSPEEAGKPVATNRHTKESETLEPDSSGPLAALVFMTSADPYVGKLTHFRVYSGAIESNSQVWNSAKEQMERIGQLFIFRGKTQESVQQLIAGDIGGTAKLAVTGTGDTLCSKDHPLTLPRIKFPKPVYSVALYPKTKIDVDKVGTFLPRLIEEDPTLQLHKGVDTGETILSGMGDAHVDVATERMQRKFGVGVKAETPRIPYKETITAAVNTEYKHKKQTGGHGQYGHVVIEVAPLPGGGDYEFVDKVVGGRVPKNYIPAVEKGLLEAKQEGVLARFPVVNIRVTLNDGSFHPVDSSEISFKIAAAQALRKGLSQGNPVLLEPIMHIQVVVPESYIGDIIGDLNTKRAKVMGMNPEGGYQTIEAKIPSAEILRYAIELRAMTQGRGKYTAEFSHYDEVPAHMTQRIISEQEAEKA